MKKLSFKIKGKTVSIKITPKQLKKINIEKLIKELQNDVLSIEKGIDLWKKDLLKEEKYKVETKTGAQAIRG